MVFEYEKLSFKNLISVRKVMSYKDIKCEIENLAKVIKNYNAWSLGLAFARPYDITEIGSDKFFDMEILIPVDKKVPDYKDYKFIDNFNLFNTFKITHSDSAESLEDVISDIGEYTLSKNLNPPTFAFNINSDYASIISLTHESEVDIYISM
ncbi:hypothetical protein JK636_12445 [Clostridium sp. YIM B02515]|uniref:DUF5085 family protein n=1 Tax=Clostridium rhizosphaerae TaxID=2803861 RepID=A0ABS1TB36_9CLOT|nr:hypothetical protein [Clostridium rhizosphaerae]MBL4936568.1 hypothetical protein [Clostridium rhizosphaerae]